MPRFVRFDRFGDQDVLEIVDVPQPEPGPGEIRVRVHTAGLNPIDWKIFTGLAAKAYGFQPPAGAGNDFAGAVDAVGAGVDDLRVGDLVYGGKRGFAQADYLITTPAEVLPVPDGLSLEQAGALDIAGRTAVASVRAVGVAAGDVVLVSAAAGGVGGVAAQLAVRAGATVVGTASPANHDHLRALGVIPVAYGDGMLERLRAAAPSGYTAVLDNQGRATLEAAHALGVAPERVNTIADRGTAAEFGYSTVGGAAAGLDDLADLGRAIAAGEVEYPIEATYPLEQVREAYDHLRAGHLRGKIVLAVA